MGRVSPAPLRHDDTDLALCVSIVERVFVVERGKLLVNVQGELVKRSKCFFLCEKTARVETHNVYHKAWQDLQKAVRKAMDVQVDIAGSSSGQGSSSGGDGSASAAGCSLRETRPVVTSGNEDGLAVFMWGRGEDGQLGLGDTSDQDEPTYVDALRGVGVQQIACGSGHTVVLTTEGEVYTWGRGDDGRLGHGDNGWKYVPRITQSLAGHTVVQVTCGSYHTAAVTSNGDLYTWGGGM